jgi:arylsulfatase A-like enzyme
LQPGRDHWPRAFSNLWAGGGIQTGGVIGATDKRGEDVIERPCSAHDFLATIYQHLGIDSAKTTLNDFNGRPVHIVNNGRPIPELASRHS